MADFAAVPPRPRPAAVGAGWSSKGWPRADGAWSPRSTTPWPTARAAVRPAGNVVGPGHERAPTRRATAGGGPSPSPTAGQLLGPLRDHEHAARPRGAATWCGERCTACASAAAAAAPSARPFPSDRVAAGPVNVSLTAGRTFAMAELALEDAQGHPPGHRHHLNDVYLAVCAGALPALPRRTRGELPTGRWWPASRYPPTATSATVCWATASTTSTCARPPTWPARCPALGHARRGDEGGQGGPNVPRDTSCSSSGPTSCRPALRAFLRLWTRTEPGQPPATAAQRHHLQRGRAAPTDLVRPGDHGALYSVGPILEGSGSTSRRGVTSTPHRRGPRVPRLASPTPGPWPTSSPRPCASSRQVSENEGEPPSQTVDGRAAPSPKTGQRRSAARRSRVACMVAVISS